MALELTTKEPRDGVVVIAVTGELDLAVTDDLEAVLEGVDENTDILVDMSGCEFLDSTGLAVLINARRVAKEAGRRFVLCAPGPQVARLLEVTGLDRGDVVAPTVEDALAGSTGQLAD
jgi:anti-sigma B factor antagonist